MAEKSILNREAPRGTYILLILRISLAYLQKFNLGTKDAF